MQLDWDIKTIHCKDPTMTEGLSCVADDTDGKTKGAMSR